jgi:hypothetical protein
MRTSFHPVFGSQGQLATDYFLHFTYNRVCNFRLSHQGSCDQILIKVKSWLFVLYQIEGTGIFRRGTMKFLLEELITLRRFAAISVLFLTACSDGGGPGSVEAIDPDPDDDIDLPSLSTQIEHWSQTGVFLAAADCG